MCSAPLTRSKTLRRPSRGRLETFIRLCIDPLYTDLSTVWMRLWIVPGGDPSGLNTPRVHALMYTDEHVGEAPINGPPDEASVWRDVCVVHMRRDMLSELALDSSGGGALPHGPQACTSPVTSCKRVTVTGVCTPLCATFCCCVCSSSMCLA